MDVSFSELSSTLKVTRVALAPVVIENYAHEGLAHRQCAGWPLQTTLMQFLQF